MPVSRIKALFAIPMAIVVVAPLVALSGVSAARDKTCAPEHNEAVVDALNQFFEAASHDDDKLFKEVLAPNFYAFDNGKRFDGIQLPQLIKAAHTAPAKPTSGRSMTRKFTSPAIGRGSPTLTAAPWETLLERNP